MTKKLSAEKKARMGLEHLVNIGHITQIEADTIVKGVNVAKAPVHMTMVFAASYLALKGETQIKDVIDMAQQFGRPIKLSWSKNRWREEHESLSRIATLKLFAQDNKSFKVEHFINAMPEGRAKRTVVKDRIRLGFESKRQRHCIASYAPRCERGDICICSVVIDKKRWTVELVAQGERYFMSQVASVLNERPTQKIKDALIELYQPDEPKRYEKDTREFTERFREMATIARAHNVVECRTEFSGCGDSGQHDSFDYYGPGGREIMRRDLPRQVAEDIDDFMEAYVDTYDENWWDNDGGQGTAGVNFFTMMTEVYISQNYNESETAVFVEGEVYDGLEGFAIDEPQVTVDTNSVEEIDLPSRDSDRDSNEKVNIINTDSEQSFTEQLLATGIYTNNAV